MVGTSEESRMVGMKTWQLVCCSMIKEKLTYQVRLKRSIIHLRDENFNRKTRSDDHSQSDSGQQSERDLEQLATHPLLSRKHAPNLTSSLIANFLFGNKLSSLRAHDRDALGLPTTTEIDLLALPVFDKNDTPQGIDDSVDNRERSKQQPARKSE